MYTDEYIRELQNRTGNDPALLERVVYAYASRVLYLAASIFTGQETIMKIEDVTMYTGMKPEIDKAKRFSYLRVVDPVAYGYFIEAVKLLQNTGLI